MKNLIDILKRILFGLSYFIVIMFALAIVVYVLKCYFGKMMEPPGFELAIISAIIGGFILSSGFLNTALPSLQRKMKRIGVFYLVATIAFVVFGICFPIVDELQSEIIFYKVVLRVIPISIVVGAVSFALGTGALSLILPELWGKGVET